MTLLVPHLERRVPASPDPARLVVAMPQDAAVLQGRVAAALADLRASGALDDLDHRWFRPAP